MSITAASLLVKVGYDDSEADRGLKDTEGKIGKAGVAIGTAFGNVGANIASQLPGALFAATTSLEDSMVGIGTLVGMNSEQYNTLEAGIKSMVQSSPDSPEELGSAAYMILSAGITDSTVALKALNDATDLAGAGLGSTEEATNLITSAMNSFKNENLDSQKAAETFFGTIASGKTTTSDLAQGFGGVAPLASAAGVSFTDLMAATAAITATGASASEAYSGLKGVMSAVIKPTKDASDTAAQLGLDFSQAHLAAVGLPAFLNEVKTATGGNVETMAKLFGGVEGLNTALALTGPQADAFAANLTNIGVAGEQMQERAAETDTTVSARFGTMKNKVMIALGELGSVGFGKLFELIDWLSPKVSSMVETVSGGFRALKAAFVFNDGDITSGGFAGVMERIGYVAAQVVDWFQANWPRIREVAGAVITQLVSIWQTQGAALLSTVSSLVQTVIGFFQTNWPTIQMVVTTVINNVVAFVQSAWPIIQSVIQTVNDFIVNTLVPLLKDALAGIMVVVQEVVAIVQEHWPQISEIITQVKDVVLAAMELVQAVIERVLQVVTIAIEVFVTVVQEIWSRWGDEIMRVVSFVFGLISEIISAALDIVKGVIQTVTSLIKGDWDGVWEGIKTTFSGVWEGIKAIVSGAIEIVKTTISTAWDTVVGWVSGLGGRIADAAGGMWDGILNAFRGAINAIIDGWNGIEFTIPGFKVGPVGYDGFTLGVPDIPRLATGGTATAAGWALVGEQGPELLHLGVGASVVPLPRAGESAGRGTTIVNVSPTIIMPAGANGNDVVRALKAYEQANGSIPIKVAN